jgi:hypothetical protein
MKSNVIVPATYADLVDFYKETTVPIYRAEANGETVAVGGLFRRGARLWAFFDVKGDVSARLGVAILLKLKAGLRQAREDAWIACDEATYPDAPRLLKAVGFEETREVFENMRVFVCRA